MTLRKSEGTKVERGSSRSPSLETLQRKRLWTCRKTAYVMIMMMMMMMVVVL